MGFKGPGILYEPGEDEWCVVCGGPSLAPSLENQQDYAENDEEKEALAVALAGLEWLNTFVGVLESELVVSLDGFDSYGGFGIVGSSTTQLLTPFSFAWLEPKDGPCGLACHENCYKVLQRDLGYTLRFQDAWPLLVHETLDFHNSFTWNDYGGISAYYGEFVAFDFCKIVADGNSWMLQDPMTNEKNAQRIVETWRTLVQDGFQLLASTVNDVAMEDVNDELKQDFATMSLSENQPQTSSQA